MQIEVFEGIDNMPEALWNQMTSGYPFVNWQWCRFGEASRPGPCYYVVVSDQGEPIGGARLAVIEQEYIPTQNALARRIAEYYIKRRPLIDCRDGVGGAFKAIFLPGDPQQRRAAAAQIRAVADELGSRHKASFAVFSYLDDALESDLWGDYLVQEDLMSRGTRLDVHQWASFDEYLRHLNQKRRKNLNRNVSACKQAGIRIEYGTAIDTARAAELIRMVHNKYKIEGFALVEPVIENVRLLPHYTWMKAFQHDRLVGCELIVFDEAAGACLPLRFGRDTSIDLVYFLMYYEEIRYAIELGARTLYGDSEVYQVKRRLGFVEEHRNNLAMKAFDPIGKLVFALLKSNLH